MVRSGQPNSAPWWRSGVKLAESMLLERFRRWLQHVQAHHFEDGWQEETRQPEREPWPPKAEQPR